jgi:hypothetical protein
MEAVMNARLVYGSLIVASMFSTLLGCGSAAQGTGSDAGAGPAADSSSRPDTGGADSTPPPGDGATGEACPSANCDSDSKDAAPMKDSGPVPMGLCAPSSYTANADTAVHGYTLPATMPAENTPSVDADFQHTSAGGICSSAGTCYSRCTGPNLAAAVYAVDSTFSLTTAFHTAAGTSANIWSSDDTILSLNASQGGRVVLVEVDPATMACSSIEELGPGSMITAGTGAISMSKTEPKVGYGYTGSPPTGMAQIDLSVKPSVVTQLYDVNTGGFGGDGCDLPADAPAVVAGGGFDTSKDVASIGHDDRYIVTFGAAGEGQDQWRYVVVIDRPTGGCAWWDVKNDVMGGNAQWPGGAKTCTSCTGIKPTKAGAGLHAASISQNGTYAELALQGLTAGETPIVWEIGTSNATLATPLGDMGHRSWGYNKLVAGSNDKWLGVMGATPTTSIALGSRSAGNDQHNSFITACPTDDNTMYSSNYTDGMNGVCEDPTVPGQNEVQMVKMDGSGTTYRFMHTKNDACLDDGNFWHAISGNVTQDGKFAAFSTDWDGTLGTDQGGLFRQDVVLVELR